MFSQLCSLSSSIPNHPLPYLSPLFRPLASILSLSLSVPTLTLGPQTLFLSSHVFQSIYLSTLHSASFQLFLLFISRSISLSVPHTPTLSSGLRTHEMVFVPDHEPRLKRLSAFTVQKKYLAVSEITESSAQVCSTHKYTYISSGLRSSPLFQFSPLFSLLCFSVSPLSVLYLYLDLHLIPSLFLAFCLFLSRMSSFAHNQ